MQFGRAWAPRLLTQVLGLATLCLAIQPTAAQEFYRGKQINLVVGSDVGGGYDTYARLLAAHWSKYIPGHPTIVVQNMPGAGSLGATNFIANVAPKDGLTVGALQDTIGYEQMMGLSGDKNNDHFDVLKMNWLGSMSKEVSIPVLWNPSPAHSLQELIDTKKRVTVGSTGISTSNSIFAHLLNAVLGTHFDIIQGYRSQGSVFVAMENGEVQGSGAPFYSSLTEIRPNWIRDGRVTVLVQIALEKEPNLPNVPLILDFVRTPQARQEIELAVASLSMGRPFVAADGVPADRVKILRDAFMATMKDPALIGEAGNARLEINAIDGATVHRLLGQMYATPQPVVDKVAAIFAPKEK
jgi:tripartite-type tricarboxylate transporter receptor subunit TctC